MTSQPSVLAEDRDRIRKIQINTTLACCWVRSSNPTSVFSVHTHYFFGVKVLFEPQMPALSFNNELSIGKKLSVLFGMATMPLPLTQKVTSLQNNYLPFPAMISLHNVYIH